MASVQLGPVQTLAVALIALQLGYWLTRKIDILRRFYIPAPVIGGVLVALVSICLRSSGIYAFKFDATLQPLFFAGFFASIGFRASARLIKEALPKVTLLLLVTVLLATAQKLMGLFLGPVLGLSRAAGLLAGSAHMGGLSLQTLAVPVMASEGATASLPLLGGLATLGLLVGGLLGGPLYAMLTKQTRVKPTVTPASAALNPPAMLKHLGAYFLVVAVGLELGPKLSPYLPAFAIALVAASIWRIADDTWTISKLELNYVNSFGNVSLSICLTLAFMNMDLSKLATLPPGAYLLAAMQIALALLVAVLGVYGTLGKSPVAAMIAAGLPGFAVGMPANTMATLQNIQEQNTHAPLVTFVVPVVGAWLITFINPWIFNWISGLL